MRNEEKLSPNGRRVSSPRYWNDRVTNRKKPVLVVRQDGYAVDEGGQGMLLEDLRM